MPTEDIVEENSTTEDTTLENNVTPEPETTEEESTEEVTENLEIPEEEKEIPETTETTETPEESDPQDLDSADLELIESLLAEDTAEEIPTEPTFFPKEEKVGEEEEGFIDEELLEDIDNGFKELESELNETKESLTQKGKDLEESNNTATAYESALDKLGDHPILGPLNEKILRGEKVDIPEYLQKSLQEDMDALPNMEDIASEKPWVKPTESLQDKLVKRAKSRY